MLSYKKACSEDEFFYFTQILEQPKYLNIIKEATTIILFIFV